MTFHRLEFEVIGLILGFALQASTYAETPRANTILVSMADRRALVAIHADQRLRLAVCPLSPDPVPDLTFAGPDALAKCDQSAIAISDTPAVVGRFGQAFIAQVETWAKRPGDPRALFGQSAAFAAKYAGVGILMNVVALVLVTGGRPGREGWRFATTVGSFMALNFAALVGVVDWIDRSRAERDRVGLAHVTEEKLNADLDQPLLLDVQPVTFDALKALALEALSTVIANGEHEVPPVTP